MSLDENKAGAAAVDPADYNTIVDAVVALQAGGGGSTAVYVQSSDPGAVGAYKLWIDTTTTPPIVKQRTAGDDGWQENGLDFGTASVQASGVGASGSAAGECPVDTAGGDIDTVGGDIDTGGGSVKLGENDYIAFETDHIAFNLNNALTVAGAGIALDQYPITNFDQLIPHTAPQVPAVPDAQDVVDALVTLGLVTQAAP